MIDAPKNAHSRMKKKTKSNNDDRVKGIRKFQKKSNNENENEVAKHVSKIDVIQHELNEKDKGVKYLRADLEMIWKKYDKFQKEKVHAEARYEVLVEQLKDELSKTRSTRRSMFWSWIF